MGLTLVVSPFSGHVTSASTNLKTKLKDFIEKKFKEMVKSIPTVIGQSANNVNSSLNTLSTEFQVVKVQLTDFLKTDLLDLLSRKVEDMVEEFITSILAVDKTIKN